MYSYRHMQSVGGVDEIIHKPYKKLLWSIGDRYHDWWPSDRGDIGSLRRCGDWKFIPSFIHYGIICDSVLAFKRYFLKLKPPQQQQLKTNNSSRDLVYTSIKQSNVPYAEIPYNSKDWWPTSNLSNSANITLCELSGISTIEQNILNAYTATITRTDNDIPKTYHSKKRINDAITKYIIICQQLFGKNLTKYKWFAVVCDAGIGPFCTLFMNIIKNSIPTVIHDINAIKAFCMEKGIPMMYMIQTPQTYADSAFNMSFIPCLTLYRFPITDKIDAAGNYRPVIAVPPPVNDDLDYPNHMQPGLQYTDVFTSRYNLFSPEYKIRYHLRSSPAEFTASNGNVFSYRIRHDDGTIFNIEYGLKEDLYRYKGPTLFELMLHYLHLNLKDFNDEDNNFPKGSTSIYNMDIYRNDDEINSVPPAGSAAAVANGMEVSKIPFISFKKAFDAFTVYTSDSNNDENNHNNSGVKKETEYIRLIDQLPRVRELVKSALGLTPPPVNANHTDIGYKPMHPTSLCLIDNYNTLLPKIMSCIKHGGDADQVWSAYLLNQTSEFYDRVVFISKDRPCVAHAANIKLRTIQYGSTSLIIYNNVYDILNDTSVENMNPKKRKGGSGESVESHESSSECDKDSIDIEQIMLTTGLHASTYLKLYKKEHTMLNPSDKMHTTVLQDFYNDIKDLYTEHNEDLENAITDVDLRYTGTMKLFMNIVRKLYYNNITSKQSLAILIILCNIHNNYYGLPHIRYEQYIKSSLIRKNNLQLNSNKPRNNTVKNNKSIQSYIQPRRNYTVTNSNIQLHKKKSHRTKSRRQSRIHSVTKPYSRIKSIHHSRRQSRIRT